MGAKTSVLVASDGDIRRGLTEARGSDRAATERVVRSLHPGRSVELLDDLGSIGEIYPQPGLSSAAVFASVTVVADMLAALDRPSQLPREVRSALGCRHVVLHAMHSVVDWFAFAIWDDDDLVRSLSLSPDTGIIEDLGEHLEVEGPFWQGAHRVDTDEYPLLFHPLDLGEEILADRFGFILEGVRRPGLFDPFDKPLWMFNVDDDPRLLFDETVAGLTTEPDDRPDCPRRRPRWGGLRRR